MPVLYVIFCTYLDKCLEMPYLQPVEDISMAQNRTKKATLTTVALGAGAFIFYSLFRKGKGLQTLNFFPDKIKSLDFDGLTPVLRIGIGVQNTSNQSFTINSIAGNVYSLTGGKTYIGNVSMFSAVTIPKNSQQILIVQARLNLIGIVNDIIDALQGGNFSQKISIDLLANVDNLQIPIQQTFNIG